MRQVRFPGSVCFAAVLLFSRDADAILEGNETTTCDWPSVVYLRTRAGEVCTGVYVGGRIVLTAAHCDDGNGLYYNHDEIHEYAGTTFSAGVYCASDAECPSVTIEGVLTQMKCDDTMGEHPGPDGSCYLDDQTFLHSNFAKEARFGEAYGPYGSEQPFNSIPIQYCKLYEDLGGGGPFDPDDFAYCVLAEEPDVQPVPIIMHCEVDEFLDGTHDLDLIAVGFGIAGSMGLGNESGRKRSASSSTDAAVLSSSATKVDLDDFATFVPGTPSSGDSGGPTFVQLPDGSWRVLAVNTVGGTDHAGVPPWRFVAWMMDDDEVLAQAAELIPCHDDDGTWAPSAACGSFPESPDGGSGEWARGPSACYDSDVSGYSSTCGAAYAPLIPPTESPAFAPPATTAVPTPAPPTGCATTKAPRGLLVGLLLGLGFLRRRRTAGVGVAVCLLASLAAGCQDDSPLTDESDDEVGDTGSLDPLEINPNLTHATAGTIFLGDKYDEIAVGNLSRVITSSICCQDYVLGGPTEASVRVLFGGGSTTNGLTFLDDEPDQLVSMADPGEGVDDLALVDLDDDGDNDLVALTTNGELARRLGDADTTPFLSLAQYAASSGGVTATGKLAVGDMDCDGDPDVTMTATDDDAVIILFNDGSGVFGSPVVLNVGDHPQDVAVGDLDGSGPLDIVTVNIDGTMSIALADTCGHTRPAVESPYTFASFYKSDCLSNVCVSTTAGATVEIFSACGDSDNDIIVAAADSVLGYCNTGDGKTFDEGEVGPWTIRWDLNEGGGPGLMESIPVHSPQLWKIAGSDDAMFAVNRRGRVIVQLSLLKNAYGKNTLPVLAIRSGTSPLEMVLSAHTGAGATWWNRAAWVSDIRSSSLANDGQIGFGR